MNYEKHYLTLMSRSPKLNLQGEYRERHRILPGCMGGKYIDGNIAWLLPEEHYVAHQLLMKMHPANIQLTNAAVIMTADRWGRRVNNKLYGWIRRRLSAEMSTRMTGKLTGDKNPMRNPETARKQGESMRLLGDRHPSRQKDVTIRRSETLKNTWKDPAVKDRWKAANDSASEKRGLAISLAKKGVSNVKLKDTKQVRTCCPYCACEGGISVMHRWHFDNCKSKLGN